MLRENFQQKLKEAQFAKNEIVVGTLRLIIAAMKDKDIAARSKGNWDGIPDSDILSMLQTMIKQRLESIKMYETGGRQDLADQEKAEIKVIEGFLPQQMNDDEIKAVIAQSMTAVGAAGVKDMGKVINDLKAKYAGQMDFAKVSGMVKEKLAGA